MVGMGVSICIGTLTLTTILFVIFFNLSTNLENNTPKNENFVAGAIISKHFESNLARDLGATGAANPRGGTGALRVSRRHESGTTWRTKLIIFV